MIDNECVIAIGYTQILEREGTSSREDAILFLRLRCRCIWNILTFLHEWRMVEALHGEAEIRGSTQSGLTHQERMMSLLC